MTKEIHQVHFPTTYEAIIERISLIDPVAYGPTRNYLDGAVSYLSPYISRGVISTNLVYRELMKRGFHPSPILKFIQELAWRDYWQQIWINKGSAINSDLKNKQAPVSNWSIPRAIVNANTGVNAVDIAIKNLYKTGYLHNHVRMYIASIACNVAQSHWKVPAQWMYYHLLDADWASNTLSWQWVAGANSNKKYYANQDNINKFCMTNQKGTFLDIPYEAFENLEIPETLLNIDTIDLKTPLPEQKTINVDKNIPTCIYNFYNLDPLWNAEITANRILLLEPSHFEQYPISKQSLDFVFALSKNIKNVQVYIGEFETLKKEFNLNDIIYKEHPLNANYEGKEDSRDWMFNVRGYYPSFFAFWKKCKKEISF
ncbi:MAG: deoxyribodipyrimidine photolyase [Eudoraea sp.]|nr:deoxyribodipyrimidine photolyase [Eudoraea sp.]